MPRNSNSGQAMTALLLIGMLATASAVNIRSPSLFRRSLLANPPAPAPTTSTLTAADSPATISGLQDAASTGTSAVTVGHYVTATGLYASTTYSGATGTSVAGAGQGGGVKALTTPVGTWGQTFSYSAVNVNGDSNPDIYEVPTTGVTVDRVKFHQKNNVWMLDTNKGTAYKVSTDAATSGAVNGVFQTGPGATNPVSVAVDSVGDAWVANLNTVGSEMGSVVKIKSSGCTGSTSTSNALTGTWTSGATSPDGCVVQYTVLDDNAVTISAIAIDGADNLWILAGSAVVGSQATNYLKVYKVVKGTSTATLLYGPLIIPAGASGFPGGNGAVVDKSGFLWTGSGPFTYGAAGTYSVLRFDTSIATVNAVANPILAVTVSDEANALSLDSDSNLWVAGGAHVTKVFTAGISAGADAFTATLGASTGLIISEASSTGGSPTPLNLVANIGTACDADLTDGCCSSGNFDAGIAITRDTVASGASFMPSNSNTIYVANTCSTGLVFPITNGATPTVGAVIPIGTSLGNLQAIAADRTSNIWLAGAIVSDSASTNAVYTIAYGTTTVTPVTVTLAAGAQVLSGYGDLTGYISAQPTASARYTYLHDTGLTGYSKWNGGSIGWTITTDGSYSVTAQVSDNLATLQGLVSASTASSLSYTPTMDAPIPTISGLGNGRYLRVDVQLVRASKPVAVGPQSFGASPVLTELRVSAFDAAPNAQCTSVYISATDDKASSGGLGSGATNQFKGDGTNVGNAVDGMCTQGNRILTIDNNSFDSDTQEADTLIVTGSGTTTTISYKSTNYYTGAYPGTGATLPVWALETSYSASSLTVYDYHGKTATCSATVAIWDDSAPTYIDRLGAGGDIKLKADTPSAPALCVWPPNIKYWCLLDIFSQSGGRFIQTAILPVRDNCAAVSGFAMAVNHARAAGTAAPTMASSTGFGCTDTDPRSQLGDCTLTADGDKYNFCVKAQRRTVFTNLDRVFTMQFLVEDAGTQQGLNTGTLFTRSLRVPAIWNFYAATTCPRATYASAASTIAG